MATLTFKTRISVSLLLALALPLNFASAQQDIPEDRPLSPMQEPGRMNPYVTALSAINNVNLKNQLLQQQQQSENSNVPNDLTKLQEALSTFALTQLSLLGGGPSAEAIDGVRDVVLKGMLAALGDVVGAAANTTTTSQCVNDTGRTLVSMFNRTSWALQFLDATGKPGPGLKELRFSFVGDYKLCRSARAPPAPDMGSRGFNGNYCSVQATLGPPSLLGQLNIQLGACMPDTCSESEIFAMMVSAIYKLDVNGTVFPLMVDCRSDEREATAATYVAIIAVVIIGTLMILGTVYDVILVQMPKWRDLEESDDPDPLNAGRHNGYTRLDDEDREEHASLLGNPVKQANFGRAKVLTGVCAQVLMAFSVYTNGSKVLNTRQPPGSLGAIHGIRFLSMSWVIMGHTFSLNVNNILNMVTEFPVLLHRWTFDAISNALFSVDTFFTLSGLLTAYLTLKEMYKRGWKINWGLFYFHRFWRLTPPYALAILIVLGFQQYLGSGAMWPSVQPLDKTFCEKNWWTNMLYINNLYKNGGEQCFAHSWYLANDMQFFILSPLMIVPFYFNMYAGLASCSVFLLVHWITTGILSTQNEWPLTIITPFAQKENILSYSQHYYMVPWCRIGPNIVGVLTGCLLAKNNGKINMNRYMVILGWTVAVATGLAVVYGIHGDISGENASSVGAAALYNSVARSAWGACVCWVIVACVSGYGGFVNTILSWSPFVVLGRLTYMAYLIHLSLLSVYFQNAEQLYYLTDTNIVVTFCGILVVTYMISFVLMLAFESPMIGLERAFIRKGKKE